jgi:DNA-binding GntR family transcriptional regulator
MASGLNAITGEGRTLRGQVLQTVRAALAAGTIAPGARINELEVAQSLGVSRGTLREALRRLEQEGFLVTRPHRGTFVRELNAEEVKQVYGVRCALETYAAETVSARLTSALRAKLHEQLENLTLNVKNGDFVNGIESDLRFHETICEVSGNKFLLDQWNSLIGPIAAVMHTAGAEFLRPLQSPHGHGKLLATIEAGDAQQIQDEWRAHFEQGARTVADIVKQRQEGRPDPAGHESGTAAERQAERARRTM